MSRHGAEPLQRLIFTRLLTVGQPVELTEEQRHYLVDVMRFKSGDCFTGIDPSGKSFLVQLDLNASRGLVLALFPEPNREPRVAVKLLVPLLKGNKLELVVQKAVELGVIALDFYLAQRSVVTGDNFAKKLSRYQKIATEAARQSRRQSVPLLGGLYTLSELAAAGPGLFAWEEERDEGLKKHLNEPLPTLSLLTGPEGGLAPAEAKILSGAGWQAVSLGPRILRAETAALAMVTCAMFAAGEMG